MKRLKAKQFQAVALPGAVAMIALLTLWASGESRESSADSDSLETVSKNAGGTENVMQDNKGAEVATFAAGCFWGVEETFRQIPGVTATAVGYMGGTVDDPSYKQVCYDNTGHAEVCQVKFDPNKVTYEELLKVFWKAHDPTQVNRQGPDVGDQYRTAIFYYSDGQKATAEKAKRELSISGAYDSPIATEITPASTFWRAEDYHQRYLQKKGLPACGLR